MWQKYKLEEHHIHHCKVGQQEFWIEKSGAKLWRLAKSSTETAEPNSCPLSHVPALPDELSWSSHVADKHNILVVVPSTPDRPIVVKPANTFTILPGMNIDIFVLIPIWVQLYASSVKAENLLLEFPSVNLSSTWFGEPISGELSYSVPRDIVFDPREINAAPYELICPLDIRNDTDSLLNFQRLSVPVNQLNIYYNNKLLCSNEVMVRFKGEDKPAEVQIAAGSPSLFEGLKLVNQARLEVNRSILKKSFSFIRSITDF